MSNEGFPFLNHKNDPRYQKIWMAAINYSEFQRLMRLENCEHISVPAICDEITLKLIEEANRLSSTELPVHDRPSRSFLVASQLFIGLIYVYEQQVIFLYDLATRSTLPKRPVIENPIVTKYLSEDDPDSPTSSKKVLKRKGSTKARTSRKRKASLVINTSDECEEDIETQNAATMELLQNAFVANKADITIRESFAEPVPNDMTEPTYPFELPFQDDVVPVPERSDYDLISTLDQQQSIDEAALPINEWEITRRRSAEMDTNYTESREMENAEAVVELAVMDVNPDPVNDLIEMDILEENNAPHNGNASSRKRRHPFKDLTRSVNVRQNVKTASTTLRHPESKGDSVSKSTCLSNLSRRIFDKPSHSFYSESMLRQFESRSMSPKLLQSFQRMTLTKPEGTDSDMVQEFCQPNPPSDTQPATSGLNLDNSITDVPLHCQAPDLSLQMDEVPIEMLSMSSQPTSISYDEQMTLPNVETSIDYQHLPVELSPVIRQILVSNETVNQFSRCDTDSQKLFASRSRQNKLDWGPEGVLQKLITLWNSGVCPIGMNEIMQSNEQRISAATAFFSVMELNSARVGLINIIKNPDSNIIFNIIKSPKLIELQQVV